MEILDMIVEVGWSMFMIGIEDNTTMRTLEHHLSEMYAFRHFVFQIALLQSFTTLTSRMQDKVHVWIRRAMFSFNMLLQIDFTDTSHRTLGTHEVSWPVHLIFAMSVQVVLQVPLLSKHFATNVTKETR